MLTVVAGVPVALTEGLPPATAQAHGVGRAGYRALQIPGQLANQGRAGQLAA
jgi:hypothetical protein